ncbi:MAG: hypothetical protein Sylvanvirus21_2 [Sylvanvirus sp.]|uniref:Uncharacterized protein n=1 Tax=Sylvanvirus sp. TaxID=2487774 RepID=A0A3G5AIP3_9VIRU|nr:MAG: hypothetical protein Sylvanvirus21_2 [Sylvanvirus sp.]
MSGAHSVDQTAIISTLNYVWNCYLKFFGIIFNGTQKPPEIYQHKSAIPGTWNKAIVVVPEDINWNSGFFSITEFHDGLDYVGKKAFTSAEIDSIRQCAKLSGYRMLDVNKFGSKYGLQNYL